MRSVLLAGVLFTGVLLGAPAAVAAQDPETPPPPPPPQVRERAVPRSEQIRQRDPESRQPAGDSGGAVRREAPRPERPSASEESSRTRVPATPSSTANSNSGSEDQARPRGEVRRPPAGDRGSGGARTADRAIPRSEAPPRPRDTQRVFVYPDYYRYYNRYYDPWGYGGYGLGYFYYSPWAWDPGYYGGYGYGYGQPRYSAYGYDLGSLKIKVKPRDAEVYVDGYFAGHVDDFDGIWQSLKLSQGGYRIEVRKPGFETLHFDVRVQPDRTITFRGELKPVP
jgi:hypothetical protein